MHIEFIYKATFRKFSSVCTICITPGGTAPFLQYTVGMLAQPNCRPSVRNTGGGGALATLGGHTHVGRQERSRSLATRKERGGMASSAEAMVTLDPAELGGEAGETAMEEEVSARAPPGAAVRLTQPPGRGASTEAFRI